MLYKTRYQAIFIVMFKRATILSLIKILVCCIRHIPDLIELQFYAFSNVFFLNKSYFPYWEQNGPCCNRKDQEYWVRFSKNLYIFEPCKKSEDNFITKSKVVTIKFCSMLYSLNFIYMYMKRDTFACIKGKQLLQ